MPTKNKTLALELADFFGESGDEDVRECIAAGFEFVPPYELARQFRETCGVLEGLVDMAEALEMTTYTALSDARRRAHEARRRCEAAAGLPVSEW